MGQWGASCTPPSPHTLFLLPHLPAGLTQTPRPEVGGQPLPPTAWPSKPKPGQGHGPETADPILSCNLTLKTLSLQALVHKRVPGLPLWGQEGAGKVGGKGQERGEGEERSQGEQPAPGTQGQRWDLSGETGRGGRGDTRGGRTRTQEEGEGMGAETWAPPTPPPVTLHGVPWLSVMGSLTPSVSSSGLENTTAGQWLRPLGALPAQPRSTPLRPGLHSCTRPSRLWAAQMWGPHPSHAPIPPHLSC